MKWVFTNSDTSELFKLFLSSKPQDSNPLINEFDHHDDTCYCALNINPEEFAQLQSALTKNNLPADLFYPENESARIPLPPNWFDRLLRLLGFTSESCKIYTPLQWKYRESADNKPTLSKHSAD